MYMLMVFYIYMYIHINRITATSGLENIFCYLFHKHRKDVGFHCPGQVVCLVC